MPLLMVRDDITKMHVDAVVNAAKESLMGGGGVDGAIHRAAGPELDKACAALGGCKTGDAKITPGFKLPAKYIIHTVGPIWHGGGSGEADSLRSCYTRCMEIADENHLETIAFPMISTGIYGYPKDEALSIATQAVTDALDKHDMTVYFVLFDKDSMSIAKSLHESIDEYIDDVYEDEHSDSEDVSLRRIEMLSSCKMSIPKAPTKDMEDDEVGGIVFESQAPIDFDLDESFTEMVLRKIDESGLKDAEVYKKANIDRKLFSKIRSDIYYKPSKPTAIALAIALRLDARDTYDLLRKAGYALSHSNKFDIVIEYCIMNEIYDIYKVNEILFSYDLNLLGA